MKVQDLIKYLQSLPQEILDSDIYLKEQGIVRKAEECRLHQETVMSFVFQRTETEYQSRTILEIR